MINRIARYKFILNFIWVGMILGVSFLATPVKFQVISLSKSVALEVGQVTFAVFNKVELSFWLLNMLFFGTQIKRKQYLKLFMVVSTILAIQTLYLLPELDLRVAQMVASKPLSDSAVHTTYVILEILKILFLLLLSREQLKNFFNANPN